MKTVSIALLAITAGTSSFAFAEGSARNYAGIAITSPSQAKMLSRTGEEVTDSSRVGAKIYGGIHLTEHVALEAGYASLGSHTLSNAGPGTAGNTRLAANLGYVAVKGSVMVGERVALFGKTGMAHTRVSASGSGAQDVSMTRAMLGFGAQYQMTPDIALTLELARYGAMRTTSGTSLRVNKMEAGLKYSF